MNTGKLSTISFAFLVTGSQLLTTNAIAQTFTKITTGPLVTTTGDSRSVNWIDVNGDGLIDCMITNGPSGGQDNMLYLNNGSGAFTAVTGSPIVMDGQPSDGATWADTDNDGDLDCYVANWYNTSNLFYINNGSGGFTAATSTITVSGGYCETASWGDYDKDGKVDLYVSNSAGQNKNLLFHNDGANTFTKITTGDPVNDVTESRSVNWTDMDGDGDLDLFVTNESGQDENIYRNDSTGFVKITAGTLVNSGGNTMSSSWGDFDNDGDLDVFLANDGSANALYRNDGNFTFTKMAADTVSKTMGNSFSSAWSDIDNDGDLDLFVTNSFGTALHANFMYFNNGAGSFTRIDNAAPVMDMDWSYGCAFGDYDNDGSEDLAVATCRFGGTDRPDLLYHNNGNSNKWITIKLTGVTTNKSAIGTKVRVKATINGSPVWQMREISAQSGYCSQNDMRAHFGLGNATAVDSIKIEWLSGAKETYVNVSPNQFQSYTEGQSVGIKSGTNNKDIGIYPNPSAGTFMISATGWKMQPGDKITVTNTSGAVVYEDLITNATESYRVNRHLAPGQYFITVKTKSGVAIKKISKL